MAGPHHRTLIWGVSNLLLHILFPVLFFDSLNPCLFVSLSVPRLCLPTWQQVTLLWRVLGYISIIVSWRILGYISIIAKVFNCNPTGGITIRRKGHFLESILAWSLTSVTACTVLLAADTPRVHYWLGLWLLSLLAQCILLIESFWLQVGRQGLRKRNPRLNSPLAAAGLGSFHSYLDCKVEACWTRRKNR